MIEQLQLILKALPWTLPAVLGGFVLALITMTLFPKRRSRTDRFGFALLTWCLVVAAVVTLSPVKNDYFGVPTVGCDWRVWEPLARQYWFSAGSRPPNVWLFFPAGVGVMLLDGVARKILGVAFLVALPPGIETLQDLYPELKRSCSSQDVADNWTGLALGLALGLVLALLIGIARLIRNAARRRRLRREGILNGRADSSNAGAEQLDARDDDPDDDAPLPLGGRVDNRHFDDFSDFDDMPNSSRWYEQGEAADEATRPVTGRMQRSGAGATRVIPADGGAHGIPALRPNPQHASAPQLDDDATGVIPRGDTRDHTPPYGTPIRGRRP